MANGGMSGRTRARLPKAWRRLKRDEVRSRRSDARRRLIVGRRALNGDTLDPISSAKAAGLHHVSDATAGIRRLGSPKRFTYVDARNRVVRDRETLARIRALAIPPAWTDVWISPIAAGHLW